MMHNTHFCALSIFASNNVGVILLSAEDDWLK